MTSVNQSANRVAMHAVRCALLQEQADAAGLPLYQVSGAAFGYRAASAGFSGGGGRRGGCHGEHRRSECQTFMLKT